MTKEPAGDAFAPRFHEVALTVLVFEYPGIGQSVGAHARSSG